MNAVQQLLTDHIDIWTAAETEKKSGRGRASGNASSVYGVKRLRELILELAVRGKLVPQYDDDEPASELFKRIQIEKAKLVNEGKIKKTKPLTELTTEENFIKLPQSWVKIRLADVVNILNGRAYKKDELLDAGTPVLRVGNLFTSDHWYYSDLKLEDDKYCNKDDLLFAWSASFGPFIWNGEKSIYHYHIWKLDLYGDDPIYKRYLYIFLLEQTQKIKSAGHGVMMTHMTKEKMEKLVVYLPPASEQRRIVAKVDELMALCDQLEAQHSDAANVQEHLVSHLLGTLTQSQSASDFNANWQRIAANFDTLFTTEASIDALKQTLLQLAVMGKLVAQDANDEPASELLKRIQSEKGKLVAEGKLRKEKPQELISDSEKAFELPTGWNWAYLGQLVQKISDGPHFSPKYVSKEEGIPFISARNIKIEGWELDSAKYVSHSDHQEFTRRTKARIGDILYTKGGTTGVAKVNDLDFEFSVWVHVAVLNIFQDELFSHYFALALNSPHCYVQSQKFTHGSSNKDLGLTRMVNITVPLPPLAEQHRIVAKVHELMTICENFKALIAVVNKQQKNLADVLVEHAVMG